MSAPIPPKLDQIAREKWGDSPLLIAFELEDIRPFVELQNLILASDKKGLPDLIVWRNYVAVKPTLIGAILITQDPKRASEVIFKSLLKLKEWL